MGAVERGGRDSVKEEFEVKVEITVRLTRQGIDDIMVAAL